MKQEDKDRGILPYMPILQYNPRQYVSYSRTVSIYSTFSSVNFRMSKILLLRLIYDQIN